MTQAAPAKRGFSVGQAAVLGLVVWLSALGAVQGIADAGWRAGSTTGVVTAGLGGALGFALMVPALGRPVGTLVSAMGLGMMGRMVLVGVGLVITLKVQQAEPFGFVLSFFPLFFVFLVLELLVAARHPPQVAGKTQES